MKEKKNLKEQKKQNLNEKKILTSNFLAVYIDMVIRGLIAFTSIGLTSYFVLIKWLQVSYMWVIPIAFLLSLSISPLLMKIKVGEKVQDKYEDLLGKIIKVIRKRGIAYVYKD